MGRRRTASWEPSWEDYARVLSEQNPWHQHREVPSALAFEIERPLARSLWQRLRRAEPRRHQLVLGPRRVGKTTCLYQTIRHLLAEGVPAPRIWWLRLDHPLLMQMSLGSLVKGLLGAAKPKEPSPVDPVYLFLDELVYAEDWDLWLKTFHDEQWPLRIAGSSSSTAVLKDRRPESGVGRWEEQFLAPYLFSEYLALLGDSVDIPVRETLAESIAACALEDVDLSGLQNRRRRFLLTGGFPELLVPTIHSDADEPTLLLQSQRILRSDAVERAVYKDIPQAFGVENPMMLERMLYTLAGQFTGVLSPTDICQTLSGISPPTFDKYLSYLDQAFLIFTLQNYAGSEATKQRRGRKLYFFDGAVRNAALQRGAAPANDPTEMGLLIENMVAAHLYALGQQSQVRLYHWREKRDEVDLVYDHPEHPVAFEIAMSTRHSTAAVKRFMAKFPRFRGRCYLVAPDTQAMLPRDDTDDVGILPLDLLLLAIGAQYERALGMRLGG